MLPLPEDAVDVGTATVLMIPLFGENIAPIAWTPDVLHRNINVRINYDEDDEVILLTKNRSNI